MNAIEFILKEHRKIRKSFAAITKPSRTIASQKKMFTVLSKFLASHEKMEETLWYPKLRKHTKLRSVIKLLISEEKAAGKVIKKMKTIKKDDELWEEKLLALKKAVAKHASDEEKKLFPKVKKLVEIDELKIIGKKLQAFRKKHK